MDLFFMMTYVTNSKYWKLIKRGWKIQVWAWTKEISSKQMWNCPASHGADYGGYLYFKNMFSPRVLSQGTHTFQLETSSPSGSQKKKNERHDAMSTDQILMFFLCSNPFNASSTTQVLPDAAAQAARAASAARLAEGGWRWRLLKIEMIFLARCYFPAM